MKTVLLILASVFTMAAQAQISSKTNFRDQALKIDTMTLGLVPTPIYPSRANYFTSDARICMKLGAIKAGSWDLYYSLLDFIQAEPSNPNHDQNFSRMQRIRVLAVVAATYCDGSADGRDDERPAYVVRTRVVRSQSELKQVIAEIRDNTSALLRSSL